MVKKADQEEDKKEKTAAPADKPKKTAAKAAVKADAASKTSEKPKSEGAPGKKPGTPRNRLVPGTYFAKPNEITQGWRLIDATGQTLGRLSSQIATILMGKDKPTYTRFSDTGDQVIVINAKDIVLTGKKWTDKVYQYHTNYPGGLKTKTAKEIREKHPERLIQLAVWRMLPKHKGHMVRKWYRKLKVYGGAEHPHAAQKPQTVTLPTARERA